MNEFTIAILNYLIKQHGNIIIEIMQENEPKEIEFTFNFSE